MRLELSDTRVTRYVAEKGDAVRCLWQGQSKWYCGKVVVRCPALLTTLC